MESAGITAAAGEPFGLLIGGAWMPAAERIEVQKSVRRPAGRVDRSGRPPPTSRPP